MKNRDFHKDSVRIALKFRFWFMFWTGGRLYGVNGAGSSPATTQGLTIDWKTSQVVDTWTSQRSFISPHDIAVARDGRTIFISEIGPNRLTKFVLQPLNPRPILDNVMYEWDWSSKASAYHVPCIVHSNTYCFVSSLYHFCS
jgi:hypothetical protein